MGLVQATGLLVEVFSVQAPDGLQTGTGAPSGNYVDVPQYQSIACMSSVQSNTGIAPTELRGLEEILNKSPRHVILDNNYPGLIDGWKDGWRCTILYPDGAFVTYDIMGVETDSQTTHTRIDVLEVEI